MRAALSHSLSRVVGQYVSLPKRTAPVAVAAAAGELLRFAGVLLLSAHPNTFSKDASDGLGLCLRSVVLLLGFDLSHDGSRAETRCMVGFESLCLLLPKTTRRWEEGFGEEEGRNQSRYPQRIVVEVAKSKLHNTSSPAGEAGTQPRCDVWRGRRQACQARSEDERVGKSQPRLAGLGYLQKPPRYHSDASRGRVVYAEAPKGS